MIGRRAQYRLPEGIFADISARLECRECASIRFARPSPTVGPEGSSVGQLVCGSRQILGGKGGPASTSLLVQSAAITIGLSLDLGFRHP